MKHEPKGPCGPHAQILDKDGNDLTERYEIAWADDETGDLCVYATITNGRMQPYDARTPGATSPADHEVHEETFSTFSWSTMVLNAGEIRVVYDEGEE